VSGERHEADAAAALTALSSALLARFPEARFSYRKAPDGLRWYLDVATDCSDDFAILEVVAAKTVELYLTCGVQIHVFPFRRSTLPL